MYMHMLVVCMQLCSEQEHKTIDRIIDMGAMEAGFFSKDIVLSKHSATSLVYLLRGYI